MPFDGSGNFNRLYSWVTDALGGLFISSTKMDQEMNGFATGLSDCMTRDGQSPPTANIPMNGKKFTGMTTGAASSDSASILDVTSRIASAEWQARTESFVFVNASQFQATGADYTATYVRGRRVKIVVTAGTTYGNISASSFGGGNTTVTVTNLNPFNLDAGLSAVSLGLISNTPTSVPQFGYALFRSSGDQAVTLNTDTQLTALVAAYDIDGETSGATYTPLESGVYLITLRIASVALGPSGMFYLNDGIVTNAVGITPVNYANAAEYGGFFCAHASMAVQLIKSATYNFRVLLGATTTTKGTYTQVSVTRLA
jgi:hypothetical protein